MHVSLKDIQDSRNNGCFWRIGTRNFSVCALLHFCTMCILLIMCIKTALSKSVSKLNALYSSTATIQGEWNMYYNKDVRNMETQKSCRCGKVENVERKWGTSSHTSNEVPIISVITIKHPFPNTCSSKGMKTRGQLEYLVTRANVMLVRYFTDGNEKKSPLTKSLMGWYA